MMAELEVVVPPDILCYGTGEKYASSINEERAGTDS